MKSAMVGLLSCVGLLLGWVAPAIGAEPGWVKVAPSPPPAAETLPAPLLVALAYGFIWLAVLAFVYSLGSRLARLEGELDGMEKRLGRGKIDN